MQDKNNIKKAIKYFESAIDKKKDDIDSLSNLGNSLLEIEKYKLAYECFRQVVKLDPTDFGCNFSSRYYL